MGSDLPRSPEARASAEAALARLLAQFGPHAADVVIIGGLNPGLLAHSRAPAHLGTVDVDVLLEVAVVFDRDEQDFTWLEAALTGARFEPDEETAGGWRWRTDVDGARVRLDLLCDVATETRGLPVALPGCRDASAMNLEGPAAAFADAEQRVVEHRDPRQSQAALRVRHPRLGGYLVTKAVAAVKRRRDDDFYDFVYVLLFNREGGPRAAARALLAAPLQDAYERYAWALREACLACNDRDAVGARAYAARARAAGDETEEAVLAQDAVGAVRMFSAELGLDLTEPRSG